MDKQTPLCVPVWHPMTYLRMTCALRGCHALVPYMGLPCARALYGVAMCPCPIWGCHVPYMGLPCAHALRGCHALMPCVVS